MTPLVTYDALVAGALLLVALWVRTTSEPKLARARSATALAIAALAMSAVALDLFGWSADPAATIGGALRSANTSTLALVTCLIGLVAVAMSPATTAPRSFATMLSLIAVDVLFIESKSALAISVLWAVGAVLLWLEARQTSPGSARVLAVYQVPSLALMGLGAWLLGHGQAGGAAACIATAIAIREAVVPVHSWLPRLFERLPMGVVVAFAAPQLGVHAHLHFFGAGLPDWSGAIALLGAVTAVVASALGTVQNDARRAVAFLFISQSGLIAFGLENHSPVAQAGALVTWQVVALATTGFAMTVAALGARRSSLDLTSAGSQFAATPRLSSAFLITGFSSVGLPLSLGFVAEDLLVQGSVDEFPLLALALVVATGFNGITVVRAYLALFCGARRGTGEADLVPRELAAITLILACLLVGGIFPRIAIAALGDRSSPKISQSSPEVPHHGHE